MSKSVSTTVSVYEQEPDDIITVELANQDNSPQFDYKFTLTGMRHQVLPMDLGILTLGNWSEFGFSVELEILDTYNSTSSVYDLSNTSSLFHSFVPITLEEFSRGEKFDQINDINFFGIETDNQGIFNGILEFNLENNGTGGEIFITFAPGVVD